MTKPDLRGRLPESWACIDCGINTAPGLKNRAEMEQAFARLFGKDNTQPVEQDINERSEVYTVKAAVWQAAGMGPMDGCLCIGCLEKRLGRELAPIDFPRKDALNRVPVGTERLLSRRGQLEIEL
jgi:hypothetical protein